MGGFRAVRERDSRRRADYRPGQYDVKRLWERSHEIINLAALGMKQVDIAAKLDITPACVSGTLNSTLGKEKLSLIRGARDKEMLDIAQELDRLVPKALQVVEEIMSCATEESTVRLRAAHEIISAGVPKKIESRSTVAHLTMDDIEEIKRRGRELKVVNPK